MQAILSASRARNSFPRPQHPTPSAEPPTPHFSFQPQSESLPASNRNRHTDSRLSLPSGPLGVIWRRLASQFRAARQFLGTGGARIPGANKPKNDIRAKGGWLFAAYLVDNGPFPFRTTLLPPSALARHPICAPYPRSYRTHACTFPGNPCWQISGRAPHAKPLGSTHGSAR